MKTNDVKSIQPNFSSDPIPARATTAAEKSSITAKFLAPPSSLRLDVISVFVLVAPYPTYLSSIMSGRQGTSPFLRLIPPRMC